MVQARRKLLQFGFAPTTERFAHRSSPRGGYFAAHIFATSAQADLACPRIFALDDNDEFEGEQFIDLTAHGGVIFAKLVSEFADLFSK